MEPEAIETALSAVGELIAADKEKVAIVVVGGTAMNLLGMVRRTTSDVDVVARVIVDEAGGMRLDRPDPLPPVLERAIRTVARDFGLDADWMNTVIAAQWNQGLPPGFSDDLTWKNYGGGLDVALVGRRTLIALKLYAAADRGADSVHVQDLLSLQPTLRELQEAAGWVKTQDVADHWVTLVDEVVAHVHGIGS